MLTKKQYEAFLRAAKQIQRKNIGTAKEKVQLAAKIAQAEKELVLCQ